MDDVYDEALADVGQTEVRVIEVPVKRAEGYVIEPWTPRGNLWNKEDLDRCEHGRHSLDPCFSCPEGQSTGNLFLQHGQRIGTNLGGEPILAVPSGDRRRAGRRGEDG
jgi:hypothetical protein